MICIQKIYGFQGLIHQIIEESWDVTPVTEEEEEEESGKNSILVDQKPQKQTMEV